jgi:hexosaminidase
MKKINWLIPVQRFRGAGGWCRVADGVTLASARAIDALPLEQLKQSLRQAGVKRVNVALDAATDAVVRLHRDDSVEHAEGYRLTIGRTGIEIAARTDAGAYYAVQTLRDMLVMHGRRLPTCRIDDWPDLQRRAIYHDTARGKVPTVETVKALIERLAHWKYNELQLYVENNFTFAGHPDIGRGFDGFTPADIHAIEAHCKLHHMRFVGSLTSFGHMELILKEPAYQHLAELPGYQDYAGGTTLCPIDPGSIELVREMYGEFLPLFDAVDFNACGDEPWEMGQGRSKARVKKVGEGRVYLQFMRKVYDICQSHGKRANFWADIVLKHADLLDKWPKDTVMLNWGYGPKSGEISKCHLFAEAGLPFVVCPGTNGWRSHGSRLPEAIGNVSNFVAAGRDHGAIGMLHTDWGDGGHRNTLGVSMLSFAHAAAHAWNGRAVDDASFPRTFARIHFRQPNNRLADAIEKLGSINGVIGTQNGFYFSLRESITTPIRKKMWRVFHGGQPKGNSFLRFDPDRVTQAVELAESLASASTWPKAATGLEPFDRLTLEEYRLAAMQDAVNGRRVQLAAAHLAGEPVAARQWRQLDGRLQQLGERFDRLWLARNRPSRLAENQYLLKHARRECQRLAGR